MNRLIHCLIFLPALIFWIPFSISFKLANKLTDKHRYKYWKFFGVEAIDDSIYDFED